MPDPHDFLSAFKFIQGSQFDGYILEYSNATRTTIKRYQEYRYNINLIFRNIEKGSQTNLFKIIYEYISQEHIIYGTKNSYQSIIDYPQYDDILVDKNGDFSFQLIGHSYRM